MNKSDCFDIFKENKSFFVSSVSDMNFLADLAAYELSYQDNLKHVTPILNEIFNFSLIYLYSDVYYLEGLAGDNRHKLYTSVDDLSRASMNYLADLCDDNSDHPTVLRYAFLDEGIANYELIMEYLNNIRNLVDSKNETSLGKIYSHLDVTSSNDSALQIQDFVCEINNIKGKKEFINYLSTNALLTALRKLLLLDNNNDTLLFEYDEDANIGIGSSVRYVENDKTIYLTELFYQLNNMLEYSNDGLEDFINQAVEEYVLYKTNQYNYLKSTVYENLILEKCKKL